MEGSAQEERFRKKKMPYARIDQTTVDYCKPRDASATAENVKLSKRLGKLTYLYEYSSNISTVEAGEIDPNRAYDTYF